MSKIYILLTCANILFAMQYNSFALEVEPIYEKMKLTQAEQDLVDPSVIKYKQFHKPRTHDRTLFEEMGRGYSILSAKDFGRRKTQPDDFDRPEGEYLIWIPGVYPDPSLAYHHLRDTTFIQVLALVAAFAHRRSTKKLPKFVRVEHTEALPKDSLEIPSSKIPGEILHRIGMLLFNGQERPSQPTRSSLMGKQPKEVDTIPLPNFDCGIAFSQASRATGYIDLKGENPVVKMWVKI